MIDWDTVLPKTPEAYDAFAKQLEDESDQHTLAWWFRHQARKLRSITTTDVHPREHAMPVGPDMQPGA